MQLEELKEKCIEEIKKVMPTARTRDLNDRIEIKEKGKKFGLEMGLLNMLDEINNNPAHKDEIICSRIKVMRQHLKSEEIYNKKLSQIRDQLLLQLKPNRWIEEMSDKVELYSRSFVDNLSFVIVVDMPESQMFVTKDLLKRWKIDGMKAEEIAVDNLSKMKRPKPFNFPEGLYGFHGDNVSALLAKPKLIRNRLNREGFKGKKVLISVPYRETMMITEYSLQGFAKIMELNIALYKETSRPYKISPTPFEMDEDGVVNSFQQFPKGRMMFR